MSVAPDQTGHDLGRYYADCRRRLGALVDDSVAEVPVPATPEWTVHDVLAHLRGVPEDVLAGNMDGVTTDPWTAAQVERGRAKSVAQLVDEWNRDAPIVEGFLSTPDGWSAVRAVVDVHTHEADVCGALGRRPDVPDGPSRLLFELLSANVVDGAAEAGLPLVRVVSTVGDACGPADAPVTLTVDRHELVRAVLGRRSLEQIAAFDWSGCDDPMRYARAMVVFGPRTEPLVD
jgi:uncharacterized protein (TIGR03083 family)